MDLPPHPMHSPLALFSLSRNSYRGRKYLMNDWAVISGLPVIISRASGQDLENPSPIMSLYNKAWRLIKMYWSFSEQYLGQQYRNYATKNGRLCTEKHVLRPKQPSLARITRCNTLCVNAPLGMLQRNIPSIVKDFLEKYGLSRMEPNCERQVKRSLCTWWGLPSLILRGWNRTGREASRGPSRRTGRTWHRGPRRTGTGRRSSRSIWKMDRRNVEKLFQFIY